MKQDIQEILDDYLRTCFLVKDGLDFDADKSIKLMALTVVSTRDKLIDLCKKQSFTDFKNEELYSNEGVDELKEQFNG